MINPCCIECGETSRLVDGRTIYPHRPDLYLKWFWLCRCGAYCGCHGDTKESLGYPCNGVTRRARSAAHAAFDPLWRRRKMSRPDAYAWLAGQLGIDREMCHIGMMDAETANRVPALVAELLKEGRTDEHVAGIHERQDGQDLQGRELQSGGRRGHSGR